MKRALFVLACALAGCGAAAVIPEVTGCASDEQWRLFDENNPSATVDDRQAPLLTQPAGAIPFAPKPLFAWQQDPNDPGKPDGDVPYLDGPGCMGCCPKFNTGALTTLHLPAISGDVYDLQFFDGATLIYRVITTLQEWTPPYDTWKSWKGRRLTLKLYKMAVQLNSPKAGPFVATQPTTLDIGS